MLQYSSKGTMPGILGNVDLNVEFEPPFTNVQPVQKSIDEIARDVLAGKYGNGERRKQLLGDKYAEVQKRVNEILRS